MIIKSGEAGDEMCLSQLLFFLNLKFVQLGKRKMHLHNDPMAIPFFQYSGPSGILPVGRLPLPLIHVIKNAKEPRDIA